MEESALLSVVVPAFREGETIFASLQELLAALAEFGVPFEVIVVSDGNSDATTSEAGRHPEVRVLSYEINRGKGFALRHGFAHARGTMVAFIDADNELHPRGLRPLLALIEAGADVAIGSKRHPDSIVRYPASRRFQSAVYQLAVRTLFRLGVRDTQTGIKVMRAEWLQKVLPGLRSDGFAIDLEMLVALHDAGAKIVEGPIELDYSFASTTSPAARWEVVKETLLIWRRRHGRGRRVRSS